MEAAQNDNDPAGDPKPVPFAVEMNRRQEQSGLSMKQAAELAGLSASRWGQIARGYVAIGGKPQPQPALDPNTGKQRRVSLDFVQRAAAVLDWPIDEALAVAGYEPGEYQKPNRVMAGNFVLESWPKLNDAQKQNIEDTVKLFLNPLAIINRYVPEDAEEVPDATSDTTPAERPSPVPPASRTRTASKRSKAN